MQARAAYFASLSLRWGCVQKPGKPSQGHSKHSSVHQAHPHAVVIESN